MKIKIYSGLQNHEYPEVRGRHANLCESYGEHVQLISVARVIENNHKNFGSASLQANAKL